MPSESQLQRAAGMHRKAQLQAKPGQVTIEGTSYEVPLKYSTTTREGADGGEKVMESITFTIPKSELADPPKAGVLVTDESDGKQYGIFEHSPNLCHWLFRAGRFKS